MKMSLLHAILGQRTVGRCFLFCFCLSLFSSCLALLVFSCFRALCRCIQLKKVGLSFCHVQNKSLLCINFNRDNDSARNKK